MINETLVAAAQYMDEHGWIQGEQVDSEGRVCMAGALMMVTFGEIPESTFGNNDYYKAWYRLAGYCRSKFDTPRSVTGVNDYVLDTKEETVKFMMEAAEWEPKQ
jgi:hypothetical protein